MMDSKLPSLKNNLNMLNNLLQSGKDPSSLIQGLLEKNPKLKNIMSLMNNSGMTPKQFFYHFAQQKGINPDQFLNS